MRRSAETRERIVALALRLFGSRGFDGVTTREIAEAANVNQAAILYHFGGKEGCYVAVAEHVVAIARSRLHAVSSHETPTRTAAQARSRLGSLLGKLAEGFIALTEEDRGEGAFILREQLNPASAFPILYRGYIEHLHAHVCELVAQATGRRAMRKEVIVEAHALIGMALSFALARATFLERTGARAYDASMKRRIAQTVSRLTENAISCRTIEGAIRP